MVSSDDIRPNPVAFPVVLRPDVENAAPPARRDSGEGATKGVPEYKRLDVSNGETLLPMRGEDHE